MPKGKNENSGSLSRRGLLRQAVATGTALGAFSGGMSAPFNFVQLALAENHPPIGTWPDGASGSSVTVGIAVPRTGTYAELGEDELKGMQLAIEHINEGNELIKKTSPKTKKGVLGKEVKYVVADFRGRAEYGSSGAIALHHREQSDRNDRLDLERGGGGDEQARGTRKGHLSDRHFRLE